MLVVMRSGTPPTVRERMANSGRLGFSARAIAAASAKLMSATLIGANAAVRTAANANIAGQKTDKERAIEDPMNTGRKKPDEWLPTRHHASVFDKCNAIARRISIVGFVL